MREKIIRGTGGCLGFVLVIIGTIGFLFEQKIFGPIRTPQITMDASTWSFFAIVAIVVILVILIRSQSPSTKPEEKKSTDDSSSDLAEILRAIVLIGTGIVVVLFVFGAIFSTCEKISRWSHSTHEAKPILTQAQTLEKIRENKIEWARKNGKLIWEGYVGSEGSFIYFGVRQQIFWTGKAYIQTDEGTVFYGLEEDCNFLRTHEYLWFKPDNPTKVTITRM